MTVAISPRGSVPAPSDSAALRATQMRFCCHRNRHNMNNGQTLRSSGFEDTLFASYASWNRAASSAPRTASWWSAAWVHFLTDLSAGSPELLGPVA